MTASFARLGVLSALVAGLFSTSALALPCGTLDEHETWGGHAKARHVGKDRTFLQTRIDDEGIFAASTFKNATKADTAITAALGSASDLDSWKTAKSGSARKVIKFKSGSVTGQSLTKSHEKTDPLSDVKGITLVLQRANNKCKYRIVTAFPARM